MVDTDWEQVAEKRINKRLDFSKIRNKDDYQKVLKEFLESTPSKSGVYSGLNIINAKKKSFDSISSEMYSSDDTVRRVVKSEDSFVRMVVVKKAKKEKKKSAVITPRDVALVRKAGLRVSVNKKYYYKQFRDIKTGRFVKNPYH